MKTRGRRVFVALLAAGLTCAAPAVAHAEPAGSVHFGLSSGTPVEKSPEQRLLELRVKTFDVSGYVTDDEAREYAELLVDRALAGELIFVDNDRSVADDYQEYTSGRTGRVFRIPRSAIEAWIDREEQHYRDAILSGGNSTPTERLGLATGADNDYIYYVEAIVR